MISERVEFEGFFVAARNPTTWCCARGPHQGDGHRNHESTIRHSGFSRGAPRAFAGLNQNAVRIGMSDAAEMWGGTLGI